jgi:osmotically-inducible protein OsmY
MLARTNDGYLSTKVKTRLLVAEGVPGSKVKVVTENGVIYLLGKITPSEADLVVAETQKSFGVQKIVKVFDYLPE